MPAEASTPWSPAARAGFVRERLPAGGLFAEQHWRISPAPFGVSAELGHELEGLGRVLHQFNRAANLLYRQSVAGAQPAWVAEWLDRGKPADLITLQRSHALKGEWPRVIRPDLLLTDSGLAITELDSVPGGIGLTAWLQQTYAALEAAAPSQPRAMPLGGPTGMLHGFASIFAPATRVHVVISEESATYRPEMEWLVGQLGRYKAPQESPAPAAPPEFHQRDASFTEFAAGDGVYRFFELFDVANVPGAPALFAAALQRQIRLTPPPKPLFEEKSLFALLWNRNLREFWRRELGEKFFQQLLRLAPRTWVVDPAPLPPHGALPGLELTDWRQLKALSQRERDLVLKVSGYSEAAWGARSVTLGSDVAVADWAAAVDAALASFPQSPYVLQRYHKPKVVEAEWFDFARGQVVRMPGRVRLCPYYSVAGEGDAARATLGGVLATVCPADKKIIHGMRDAILAPAAVAD